ncbi:HDOD domain-containing protein [Salidesulfovibrio onnuriiensis]|uniref:HDOD domain-containing protein n=1 Tax=Salidesulfovibrio onnuriiensis TaxID=2583823 RepID=UPI0011C7E21B|nr:HDOD domain-containing protein [Salidesulfovibrio onnuriiensis]
MPHEIQPAVNIAEIAPEVRERAKALMTKRFKYIMNRDDTFKALAHMGLERTMLDMAADPGGFVPGPIHGTDGSGELLDPLDILRKELQLPALPQVFLELQQAINAPHTSSDDLAKIISQDPSLTAFLLRMVNSAFYSLPIQIDTITRAVTVVGVNQLTTLAVGTSVLSLFKDIPPEMIDMERFWMHSIGVGIIARKLCRLTGQGDPERSFVAGLLHDIGQLVLLKAVPERQGAVIKHGRAEQKLLFETEKEMLGFDHATLGGMLLRKWNFPYVLVSAVLEHHQPKRNQKEAEPKLVHCAETIATGLGIGSSGEFFTQPPDRAVWDSLSLTPDKLENMIQDLDQELEEAFSILVA